MLYSDMSNSQKREAAKIIRKELAKMPSFVIEKCAEYNRIALDADLLDMIWD